MWMNFCKEASSGTRGWACIAGDPGAILQWRNQAVTSTSVVITVFFSFTKQIGKKDTHRSAVAANI